MREIPTQELSELLSMIDKRYVQHISCLMTNTTNSAEYLSRLETPLEIELAPSSDILGYCALVNSSDIVIAVDGGGVHISCALGKNCSHFMPTTRLILHAGIQSLKKILKLLWLSQTNGLRIIMILEVFLL